MPNFILKFQKEFEILVEADDLNQAMSAGGYCSSKDVDYWNEGYAKWKFVDAYPGKNNYEPVLKVNEDLDIEEID